VAWIERGVRPQGDDVLGRDLSRVGLKWTPILHLEDPLAGRNSSLLDAPSRAGRALGR
jgi:hypothetical protein